MVKFDKEELMKIARLSSLKLYDSEVEGFVDDLKVLLEYLEEIQKANITTQANPVKNINVFREDEVKEFNSSDLLKIAPKTNNNYFSVPKIGEGE